VQTLAFLHRAYLLRDWVKNTFFEKNSNLSDKALEEMVPFTLLSLQLSASISVFYHQLSHWV